MLAKAQELGVFSQLHRMVMGDALEFDDGAFAGAIVTGFYRRSRAAF